MKRLARLAVQGLTHIVAPRVCHICGTTLTQQEHLMCIDCLMQLPRTGVHRQDFNEIHRRLGHHYVVDRAAGWFHYTRNSPYARMLVDAKYRDMPDMACALGRMCAAELAADGFFDGIDALVPMPMHRLKQWLRGYNQAREVARGVSDATALPVTDALEATRGHGVQARRGRAARFGNIANTMALAPDADIAGKHILIIDDIITTGASMAEAIRALSAGAPASISILCLGLTRLL